MRAVRAMRVLAGRRFVIGHEDAADYAPPGRIRGKALDNRMPSFLRGDASSAS